MIKAAALSVLIGVLVIPIGACTLEDTRPAPAPDTRSTAMPDTENIIYYLEIVTADPRAAADFYAEAYGWQFAPEAPELGNALTAPLPGGSLCGIRAPMGEQEQPVVRTYLRVDDLDAAVKQAEQLGATIALPRLEIPGRGAVAIYFLGGIEQGLWQVP